MTCSTSGGWKGVAVGEAFGATVINTKGNWEGAGAVPQEASKIEYSRISLLVDDSIGDR